MDKLLGAMKRHPVVAFYILAFAISWLGWVPQTLHAYGLFPFDHLALSLLGGLGPTLAAVIVVWAAGGRGGLGQLFAPLLRLRVSVWWFVFVFGFWLVVAALVLGLGAVLGQPLPAVGEFAWLSLPFVFVTMLLSNVWEEIGWRGFALPRLQESYGDLKIVFLMGILWYVWHLPLMLNPASPMSGLPWFGDLLFTLALTVIYTWLYQNTARSLFFVTVFHAMSNTVAFALVELGVFVSTYLYVVGVTALVAVVIVVRYGPRRFANAAPGTAAG